jgi:hypothetical protein
MSMPAAPVRREEGSCQVALHWLGHLPEDRSQRLEPSACLCHLAHGQSPRSGVTRRLAVVHPTEAIEQVFLDHGDAFHPFFTGPIPNATRAAIADESGGSNYSHR